MRSYLAALVISGCCALWPASASARAVTETEVFTFHLIDEPFFNQCPGGEDMLLNGSVHLVIRTTQDAEGGWHLLSRQSGVFQAVGLTTGAKYVWQQVGGSVVNQRIEVPFVFAQAVSDRIVGQGPNHGQLLKDVAHVTVNANGELAASFEKFSTECP